MDVEVRGESVVITGYVNAVERYSKPITSSWRGSLKTFIEKIKAGVFKTALKRNDNVKVLLNHNWDRELANTRDGTAKLEEDNIGLRAEVVITDADVVKKAREGKLVGWSFGFRSNSDEAGTDGSSETRTITDLDLEEVSILDDCKRPAYNGTSIEARCEGGVMEIREEMVKTEEETEKETEQEQTEEREEAKEIDVEQLAEVVASKVLDKLNAREAKSEERTDVATEQETETEETETEEEEETEERTIDYSYFENRMANL